MVVELEAGEEITSEVGNIGQGTYRNKNQDKRWHRKGIEDVWWRRHDRYRWSRSGKGYIQTMSLPRLGEMLTPFIKVRNK